MIKKLKNFLRYKRGFSDLLLLKYKCKRLKTLPQKKIEISKEFKEKLGYEMDWNNPVSYLQKLNYSKLLCANKIKTRLTDKLLVREWVEEKIGKQYLVPLLGVYDCFSDINVSELPEQFVIKCNHDSASVTICNDKTKLDLKRLKQKYNFLMRRNFSDMSYEMHYRDIKPKILIEKHMGSNINDYKFICFDGKPVYCWVDIDRFSDHRRCVFDMEWKEAPFTKHTYAKSDKVLEKPAMFETMKTVVKKLCDGFDYVRVDLYLIDGVIYFGEMTFTDGRGQECVQPIEWDYKLGEMWKLDINS